MMTGWLLLASEAAESGFGLNSNILETNVINLAIIFGLIYYVGSGFLKKTLSERREAIVTELTESERRRTDAEAKLKQAQDQLADAKAEGECRPGSGSGPRTCCHGIASARRQSGPRKSGK
jgi:F-type H+-transporting ATPase subunit b